MDREPDDQARFEVVVYNDEVTPFEFVVRLLNGVFAVPTYEAEVITQRISKAGKYAFGPFPKAVAAALHEEARSFVDTHGYKLLIENLDFSKGEESGPTSCSFCGKTAGAVQTLIRGRSAYICNECVVRSAGQLHDLLPTAKARLTYELLDWHFGDVAPDSFVKTSRSYPSRVRADLQTAIEEMFTSNAIRAIGIKQQHAHEEIDLTALWTKGRSAHGISPLSFEELDIGEDEPKRCQVNGLWLLAKGDLRYAAVLSRQMDYMGGSKILVEISGPQGEEVVALCRSIFDTIEGRIREGRSYRGKILSLEQSSHYEGVSTGITVHRISSVDRSQVILPQTVLTNIDRSIVRFCRQRDQLRDLGLRTKRGVLFHGSPGTGKTHTIRYLASQLPGHTTFLVTAEQIGLLPEYFSLARLLQPVIFVIEDADLLAKSRDRMHSTAEQILLNQLLNEMDGLKEDADILFILSSNKPEVLEEALVARPGRIDQLIEFPKPDGDCRRQLMSLYGGTLKLTEELAEDVVARTGGVSASFIKELMRRLAQYTIERGTAGAIERTDVDQALEEMLFQNNALNRAVLGAAPDE